MHATPFSTRTLSALALALLIPLHSAGAAPQAGGAPATPRTRSDMHSVPVPAGSFAMGAGNDDREAGPAEKPRHTVTLTRPFYLARHEVTQAQWEAVMGRSPYEDKRSNPYYGLPGMAERLHKPDHPATVSWNDAQAFIRRLNELEGHARYRLPTEAEWEYAALAGTTTAYSFGDDVRQLGRHAWFGGDFATGSPPPVGPKLPNAWGFAASTGHGGEG